MSVALSLLRRTLTGAAVSFSLLALAALTVPVAHAQIVYDNGGPGDGGAPSDFDGPFIAAETFSLTSTSSVNTVQWFGVYAGSNTPPTTDDFTISFYNTIGGVPNGTPIVTFTPGNAVNRIPTGGSAGRYPVFQYTASLSSPVTFTAGTTYGIGIANNTTNDLDDNWFWAFSNQSGQNGQDGLFFAGFSDDPSFYSTLPGGDLAFNLQGSRVPPVNPIPEPGAVATGSLLGATMLLGMVRGRRRKGAAKAA